MLPCFLNLWLASCCGSCLYPYFLIAQATAFAMTVSLEELQLVVDIGASAGAEMCFIVKGSQDAFFLTVTAQGSDFPSNRQE